MILLNKDNSNQYLVLILCKVTFFVLGFTSSGVKSINDHMTLVVNATNQHLATGATLPVWYLSLGNWYTLDVAPSQDASDHQGYHVFSRESL